MLEIYQEWDILKPKIPPRSYLIPLQPIAKGTPQCESLISYIIRLASTHCLSVAIFYAKILRPHVRVFKIGEGYKQEPDIVFPNKRCTVAIHSIRYWNGADSMAKSIVKVLESLTRVENLASLTLLPWTEVLARMHLLRRYRAWCPYCYEKWKKEKQPIYEPLSWSIKAVEVCSLHQTKLVEECPSCQKKLLPLAYNVYSGYCLHCRYWLGRDTNNIELKKNDTYQMWVANSIGELIAESAFLNVIPTRKQLHKTLSDVIKILGAQNASLLGRHIGISGSIINSKNSIPMLEHLLKLSYFLNLPLKKFLLAQLSLKDWEAAIKLKKTEDRYATTCLQPHASFTELEQTLNEELLRPLPLSVKKIGQSLGFLDYRSIFHKYPELCKQIKAKRAVFNKTALKAKKQQVLLIIQNALKEEPPPLLSKVMSKLGYKTDSFLHNHFPDQRIEIFSRYKKYKKALKENLKKQLELSLLINPPPTLLDIAKKEGYSNYTLHKSFPLLCKAITFRHKEYKKCFFEERRIKFKEQIKEIVISLIEQDIYPSKRQVREILFNPYIRCLSTLNKILKEIRQDLNISYQHLV